MCHISGAFKRLIAYVTCPVKFDNLRFKFSIWPYSIFPKVRSHLSNFNFGKKKKENNIIYDFNFLTTGQLLFHHQFLILFQSNSYEKYLKRWLKIIIAKAKSLLAVTDFFTGERSIMNIKTPFSIWSNIEVNART